MTIEFIDGRYFAALWYLEDEPRGNWMGAVYRDEGEDTWHLVCEEGAESEADLERLYQRALKFLPPRDGTITRWSGST